MADLPTVLEYTTVHVTIEDLVENATTDTRGKVTYTPDVTTIPGIGGKITQVETIRDHLIAGSSSVNLLTGITWTAEFHLQGDIPAPAPITFTTDGSTINLAYEVTAAGTTPVEIRTVVLAGAATTAQLDELAAEISVALEDKADESAVVAAQAAADAAQADADAANAALPAKANAADVYDKASADARYVMLSALPLLAAWYGVRGDRIILDDAAMTSGSGVLTSATASFTASDVGKIISVKGAGAAGDRLSATISSRQSATQVTLSASAATTVASTEAAYGTNNNAALAALIAAIPASGATIFLPRGGIMYSTQIAPPNHSIWQGEGMDVTEMTPIGATHGFYRLGDSAPTPTPADPVIGVQWRDLTVNGDYATGQMKGWYLNHMIECRWVRTKCIHSGASGYGVDYLRDCWFEHAIVEDAGRAGTIASPGFSGFGIGSGAWERENVYFVSCVSRNNKRFGLFIENQDTATQSFGAQVIGGLFEGNQWGISDNGTLGLIVKGAHIRDNVAHGFVLTTTAAIEQVGYKGELVNCQIIGNGGDGVQFDWTLDDMATFGHYRARGNLVEGNTGYGIRTRAAATRVISAMEIEANTVRENGQAGIAIAGGILQDSKIKGNDCFDNGSIGNAIGIMVTADLVDVDIVGNRCADTGSGNQDHGIYLSASLPTITVTGGRIADNDLRGNVAGAIAGYSQVTSGTKVLDNPGFQPVGVETVTPTGSPMTYTAGAMPETHYIIGGTISSITLNGTTILNAAGQLCINLAPWDVLVVTYSAAITSWKRRRG